MYEEIFRKFNKNNIKYIVVGGIAVNLHGAMRSTADLDVAVELTVNNVNKIFKSCKELGYKLKQPIKSSDICDMQKRQGLIKAKSLKAVTFYKPNGFEEIDILIDLIIPFDKLYKNSDACKLGDLKIRLISIDDLIKMKSDVARPLDKLDIQILRQIKTIRKKRARK